MLKTLKETDPQVYQAITQEIRRQAETIELIASENFVSEAVLEAQGSVLTNKYAEGYPAKRWYNGCENVDIVESLAIERAKKIFGAEHVNVQPHSGSQANMAVYFSVLNAGDTILAMNLAHGGHLTHGHPMNFSGKFYKIVPYGVDAKTECIDYDALEKLALESKPKLILGGASAYPRIIDSARLRKIADKVGALLMVDMAHFAGLVAAGLHPNPLPDCDFVTTTTHKTLRGPRGGMVLCRKQYAEALDKMVFPGIQGGPLMHVIAAKAVALGEALTPSFKAYQEQIVRNAKALAAELSRLGLRIVSGGTDNHLMLVDTTSKNITGKEASNALHEAGITCNKNMIPFDKASPFQTSGIRLGTPAVTTRGMKEGEMKVIASVIVDVLSDPKNEGRKEALKKKVLELCHKFPLYEDRLSVALRD